MAIKRFRLIASISCILAFLIIIVNLYTSDKNDKKLIKDRIDKSSDSAFRQRDDFEDAIEHDIEQAARTEDLPERIQEMMRIRKSVMKELSYLESKRNKITNEVSQLTSKYDLTKVDLSRKQMEVERLKSLISQLELLQREASLQEQPFILRPLRILPSSLSIKSDFPSGIPQVKNCSMEDCFDYSRCPLTSAFPVFFYPCASIDQISASRSGFPSNIPHEIRWDENECQKYVDLFHSDTLSITSNPKTACIFIVILPFSLPSSSRHSTQVQDFLESYFNSLNHWKENGQNHIIVNLLSTSADVHDFISSNRAMIAQPTFSHGNLRPNFDLVIIPSSTESFSPPPPLSPARRSILASFQSPAVHNSTLPAEILTFLTKLQSKTSIGSVSSFHIDLSSDNLNPEILSNSTFTILMTKHTSANHQFTRQLGLTLSAGSIPVIIGAPKSILPFNEVIDWSKAVILLPLARLTEINLILRSFTDADIIQMRANGRMLFSRIFESTAKSLAFLLSIIRTARLQIPPPPVTVPQSKLMYADSEMKFYEPSNNEGANAGDGEWSESSELDEELGPVEPPKPSPSFTRNFSLSLTSQYDLYNREELDPLALYPHTPFDPLLPTEARFIGSSYGFRPIGEGAGGSGFEFSRSLGGNLPREQFTVVVLTYEREAVLMDTLHRLKGLPYLNKVIVIWNNPNKQPDSDLRWPLINVPIVVIKTQVNSLNNRFIPYEEIETEAILSLDDDTHLRHDEIVFAFRVWREARDRIVGFPGRYHAWDIDHRSWLYNSNHSCELSMVLTGAAFLHKYFTYRYTFSMSPMIREIVDKYTNCEDIAMNFLVSHITRKPPIKVTSRWTFTCAGCSMLPSAALSESNSHFEERHKCINLFTGIYGYNPLLNTQFRADSVLFKTRISREKQKCFKYV